jgi:hypothetical protein
VDISSPRGGQHLPDERGVDFLKKEEPKKVQHVENRNHAQEEEEEPLEEIKPQFEIKKIPQKKQSVEAKPPTNDNNSGSEKKNSENSKQNSENSKNEKSNSEKSIEDSYNPEDESIQPRVWKDKESRYKEQSNPLYF